MARPQSLVTYAGHVLKAIEAYEVIKTNRNYYFGLGKTSPWLDETQPPQPFHADTELQEIIGFKRVNLCNLIYPDSVNGTITYKGMKFSVALPETALQHSARWLYISSSFIGDEFPLVQYRQVGLFSKLVRKTGVDPVKDVVLSSEVDFTVKPFLYYIENREFCKRQINQTDTVTLVLEF